MISLHVDLRVKPPLVLALEQPSEKSFRPAIRRPQQGFVETALLRPAPEADAYRLVIAFGSEALPDEMGGDRSPSTGMAADGSPLCGLRGQELRGGLADSIRVREDDLHRGVDNRRTTRFERYLRIRLPEVSERPGDPRRILP